MDANGNLLDWQNGTRIPASIGDGTSNTILFTERYGACGVFASGGNGGTAWAWWGFDPAQPNFAVSWGQPTSIGPLSLFQSRPTPFLTNCDPYRASSSHTGLIVAALADASVRTIANSISGTTWWWAVTANGGEVLGSDW